MKKLLLFIYFTCCTIAIGYAQVYGRTEGNSNWDPGEWITEDSESLEKKLTYWDDLGIVDVKAWSKEFRLMYKAHEARLQYCYKDGRTLYRLAVKYTSYDEPIYINVTRGNYYVEGTYYNARADYYYFNMNESSSSNSYSNMNTTRTFYPISATMNDEKGSFTSENFNCPSMTVMDNHSSILIHWNGEKIPLQNNAYDNDTYRTYQSNTQGSVEILAYRSSSTRSIYLVVVNIRMGNEKIKINFKP